jgi:hypothetical protein
MTNNKAHFKQGTQPWNKNKGQSRKTATFKLRVDTLAKIQRLGWLRYPTQAAVIEAAVALISEES